MTSSRPYASPRRNLADTATSVDLLWREIGREYGGGELHSLERAELHELDCDAGIDFVQFLPNRQRRTWASRFQWGPVWYASFSIRVKTAAGRPTEYQKRLLATREGTLLPDRTLQGYLDGRPPSGGLIAAATIETRALYRWLDGPDLGRHWNAWAEGRQHRPRGDRLLPQPLHWCGYRQMRGGEVFMFLTWELLEHVGLPITVHHFRDVPMRLWDPVVVSHG